MREKILSVIGEWVEVRQASSSNYFGVLDGWRGLSILLVLATHLLPLGPKAWRLNETAGPMGMALFFTLSGFLIANFLIHRPSVKDFLIRRFYRIIPLAWIYLVVAFLILDVDLGRATEHFLFFANWPPIGLVTGTSHFWSLCVEVQFYVGIAFLFRFLGQRSFHVVALLCVIVTLYRLTNGVHISINTYYRIDEIFAGVLVAMIYNDKYGELPKYVITKLNPWYLSIIFIISCHPESGALNYIRPYVAASLVAYSLCGNAYKMERVLNTRILVYIATISYALYVIHPILVQTWLGEGDVLERYAKRPLLFGVLLVLAHFSTFYYEKYWIRVGKKLTTRS